MIEGENKRERERERENLLQNISPFFLLFKAALLIMTNNQISTKLSKKNYESFMKSYFDQYFWVSLIILSKSVLPLYILYDINNLLPCFGHHSEKFNATVCLCFLRIKDTTFFSDRIQTYTDIIVYRLYIDQRENEQFKCLYQPPT